MSEPRAIFFEERGNGSTVLVGRWPERALIDPMMLPEIAPDARSYNLRPLDDFALEVANAKAIYRFIETTDHGEMLCIKIR
jgi:hypothetical protein